MLRSAKRMQTVRIIIPIEASGALFACQGTLAGSHCFLPATHETKPKRAWLLNYGAATLEKLPRASGPKKCG